VPAADETYSRAADWTVTDNTKLRFCPLHQCGWCSGEEPPGPLVAPAPPRYYQAAGGRLKCINGALVLLGQLAVKGFGAAASFSMTRLESPVQRLGILMKAMRRLVASML